MFTNIYRLLILTLFFTVALWGCTDNNDNHTHYYDNNSITIEDVKNAQQAWADGLIAIGKAYADKEDYNAIARQHINTLYAYNYEEGIVLFKPTQARDEPFRNSKESALSYFVGDNLNFVEDKGFALKPWTNVIFHNNEMYFHKDMAIAMGKYIFIAANQQTVEVEYTFGYVKDGNGQLRIVLHHSSLPYDG